MAKFSFSKELFKCNDPEWLAKRELQLEKIENIFCDGNKSKKISRKKYFLKGEWNPESKYDLSFTLKFLFLPEINIELFYKVMAEIPWDQGKVGFRKGVFGGLLCGDFPTLMECNLSDFKNLIIEIVDNLESYSDETFIIEGVTHRRFPLHIEEDSGSVFFSVFLDRTMEWLTKKSGPHLTGFTFFVPHWFSGLEYLKCNEFESDFKRDKYLNLFTLINHYIPEHMSNQAAKQKLEFVNEFKRYANENGFAKAFLTEVWEQAKLNSEEEWLNRIFNCTPESHANQWDSWCVKPAYKPLFCRTKDSVGNLHSTIAELYEKNGYCQVNEKNSVKHKVDITELLTADFIAELPEECRKQVCGELVSINLTDKYMGTDKTHFQLDIIKILNLPENTENNIPRLMILERPRDYFVPCFARRYGDNQRYMVDAIKAETGFQLVRYYGFSHDLERERTVPPAARDHADYEREMELPFYDAAYLPLKVGNTAFILNDDNEYTYLT